MALWRPLARGLRVLTRRAAADREIDDELRHWIDEATAQHVARGLDPRTARRAALAEIGPPTLVRERVRDHGWEQWVTSWLQDLRLAGRTLRQTPLFTAIVVLVVALGTGAVSTVFSAMNALLLRPVPGVGDPAGVVTLLPARRDGGTSEQIGYARYLHLRDHARTVAGIGAWGRTAMTISTGGAGRAVLGNLVTADYFDLLGIQPARGRFFAAAEEPDARDASGAGRLGRVLADTPRRRRTGDRSRDHRQRPPVHAHRRGAAGLPRPLHRTHRRRLGAADDAAATAAAFQPHRRVVAVAVRALAARCAGAGGTGRVVGARRRRAAGRRHP